MAGYKIRPSKSPDFSTFIQNRDAAISNHRQSLEIEEGVVLENHSRIHIENGNFANTWGLPNGEYTVTEIQFSDVNIAYRNDTRFSASIPIPCFVSGFQSGDITV